MAVPATSPENHKYKLKIHPDYVKIIIMISQKSYIGNLHGGGWLNRELKFLGLFLALISFSNLVFSKNTFALYTPTLSASVDQANLQVNGNQVINSTDKTTEIPFTFTVNTNNRTGYTATLSSETDNTALTNATSTTGAKINSISTNLSINNLPNNTWGYKFGTSTNYAPIPALSSPAQILQTAGKTNGNELNQLSIGMKLGNTLESGNYVGGVIISVLTNDFNTESTLVSGDIFNQSLINLAGDVANILHIKNATSPPSQSVNKINIEVSEWSDVPVYVWYEPITNTIYYYSEAQNIFWNENSAHMFRYFRKLQTVDLSRFNTSRVKNMVELFRDNYELKELDVSKFDTSNCVNMAFMFYDLQKIHDLDISHFDTSKARYMHWMFYGMRKLNSIDLSNFNTENVENMAGMFSNARALTSLNLSNFRTSKVKDMSFMFEFLNKIETLDLSNFDTSSVVNMEQIFSNMEILKNLNISSFNTENVENMNGVFGNTYGLESIDVSNFRTSKVKTFRAMFIRMDAGRNKLKRIYASADFDTTAARAYQAVDQYANIDIFSNQLQLVGGNGTTIYTKPSGLDYIDLLRIDRPGVAGFFTLKS